MTDRELLELLVTKFDSFEKDVKEVKLEMQTVKQEMQTVNARLDNLEKDVREVKQEMQTVKQDMNTVKQEVKQNTIAIETTVSQCLDAYGDGIIANREKMDRLNIDSVNDKMLYLNLRQRVMDDEIKRIKLKIS